MAMKDSGRIKVMIVALRIVIKQTGIKSLKKMERDSGAGASV
jgi:hypothetical protein